MCTIRPAAASGFSIDRLIYYYSQNRFSNEMVSLLLLLLQRVEKMIRQNEGLFM